MDHSEHHELSNELRKLWEQHVQWTRHFIISTAANLGDLKLVTNRLLQNPTDFARVLRYFYGDAAASEFENLFRQHLLIAADLVNHAKAGNTRAAEADRKKWYQNAADIAAFLAKSNPYWDENEWRNMLFEHLRMTEDEATYRLKGEYAKDIEIYNKIEEEALAMADMMTDGISRQFGLQ